MQNQLVGLFDLRENESMHLNISLASLYFCYLFRTFYVEACRAVSFSDLLPLDQTQTLATGPCRARVLY